MTTGLNPDGPRDPESVLSAAGTLSAAVRYLARATRDPGAFDGPFGVFTVLLDVEAALAGLPQVLGQVAGWLDGQYADGRITMDGGGEFPSPVLAVMAVQARLEAASGHLETARGMAASAADVTSHMKKREDGGHG